ncbi:MAG TPA: endonuclease domain-containing protein [Chitinophagaceae bacterium]|jgi:very-short-patch-repair endonuclease|nr:endonuclease domain-containing protein [Chitinophagaceae bacterium]
MRRKIIPYNPALKKLAQKLRYEMTFSEVKLWKKLRAGGMMDYDFDRQRPIANYIVDFYCKDLMLAIEIDGMTHDDEEVSARDMVRQMTLEKLGVRVIRFNALEVVHNIENVMRAIEHWILDYEEKFGVVPHIREKRLRP